MITKQITRLINSPSEPCTHYKNSAYPACFGRSFITELINSSQDCEKPCKVALMQNYYELLPNNTIPKCLMVKDHNCMMKHSYNKLIKKSTCKPSCSLTQYKGLTIEKHAPDKIAYLGIDFRFLILVLLRIII
jgi:hypothetical protein